MDLAQITAPINFTLGIPTWTWSLIVMAMLVSSYRFLSFRSASFDTAKVLTKSPHSSRIPRKPRWRSSHDRVVNSVDPKNADDRNKWNCRKSKKSNGKEEKAFVTRANMLPNFSMHKKTNLVLLTILGVVMSAKARFLAVFSDLHFYIQEKWVPFTMSQISLGCTKFQCMKRSGSGVNRVETKPDESQYQEISSGSEKSEPVSDGHNFIILKNVTPRQTAEECQKSKKEKQDSKMVPNVEPLPDHEMNEQKFASVDFCRDTHRQNRSRKKEITKCCDPWNLVSLIQDGRVCKCYGYFQSIQIEENQWFNAISSLAGKR